MGPTSTDGFMIYAGYADFSLRLCRGSLICSIHAVIVGRDDRAKSGAQ